MDRFIVYDEFGNYVSFENLKSNMDRFIAATQYFYACLKREFKIQYG